MERPNIEVHDWALGNLVYEIEEGKIRIPRFQRNYVWSRSETVKLLNSIYKEFPIGSFFLWKAPEKYKTLYKEIPELGQKPLGRSNDIRMILDGQQRITSIYVTVKGLKIGDVDYKQICFDLEKEIFVDRAPDNTRFISLFNIISSDDFQRIYDQLDEAKRKMINKCKDRFKNYPFSIVEVFEKELEDAIDIFENINQRGKRLQLFDLIVAGTWSEDFDLRIKADEFSNKVENQGFGQINYEVFTQSLSLMLKNKCTRSIQLQLKNQDIVNNWDNLIKYLELAISYAQRGLGVVQYDFFPYPALLSMLTYFFSKLDSRSPNSEVDNKIKKWFWNVSLSERYKASTLTLMGDDRKMIDAILSKGSYKYEYPVNIDYTTLIEIPMGRISAIKNAVMCLLAKMKPLHFKTGNEINIDSNNISDFNSTEKHHIFPRSFLIKLNLGSKVNALPNFCFIPAELNKEISNNKPSRYFKLLKNNRKFKQIMRSHLIPVDDNSGIWKDDYDLFLEQRAELILKEFQKLFGS